jgi:Tfp pilus assembly protein PilF
MTRSSCRFVVGIGLLANAGCLTPLAGSLTLPTSAPIEKSASQAAALPNKESAEICVALGSDLEKTGFLGDAVIQYEKARKLDPRLTHLGPRIAVLYDKVGEERKAVAEFEECVKQTPKDADLWNDFGYCHYNHGRWADAAACFHKALSANDKHGRASVNLGLTLAQQGKYTDAEEVFRKVTRPAEAKANVAFVLAARGNTNEAKKLYHEALALEPNLTAARQALASLDAPKPPAAKADPAVKLAAVTTPKSDPVSQCQDNICRANAAAEPPNLEPVVIDPKAPPKRR